MGTAVDLYQTKKGDTVGVVLPIREEYWGYSVCWYLLNGEAKMAVNRYAQEGTQVSTAVTSVKREIPSLPVLLRYLNMHNPFYLYACTMKALQQ